MKSTGIVRRLDSLGRVVIPKELRKNLYLQHFDPVEVFTEDDRIILKKYEPHCILCGEVRNTVHFNSKLICKRCIEEVIVSC